MCNLDNSDFLIEIEREDFSKTNLKIDINISRDTRNKGNSSNVVL